MKSVCRFCNIIDGNYYYEDIDSPFACNSKYLAIASIGAMVEGWSLIVPKEHQLSMRSLYADEDFSDFTKNIVSRLIKRYGPIISFEHGSNIEGSITACGTDHAHLHLVPFRGSLLLDMQKDGLKWIECRTSDIPDIVENNEYLFYSEINPITLWDNPIGYVHVLDSPISQFFRKLIAERLGYGGLSDYRTYPNLHIARQTYRNLVG